MPCSEMINDYFGIGATFAYEIQWDVHSEINLYLKPICEIFYA